jgi:protein tyrosine/serine phosphatase
VWNACDEDVLWFLRIAADPARAPVFLHCQHGADRTGYLVAMYRVVVEGWDRERAIAEMTCDGNGFHPLCRNLIRYVRQADIERLRSCLPAALVDEAGHAPAPQQGG